MVKGLNNLNVVIPNHFSKRLLRNLFFLTLDDFPGPVRLAAGRAIGGFGFATHSDGLLIFPAILAFGIFITGLGCDGTGMATVGVMPIIDSTRRAAFQRILRGTFHGKTIRLVQGFTNGPANDGPGHSTDDDGKGAAAPVMAAPVMTANGRTDGSAADGTNQSTGFLLGTGA